MTAENGNSLPPPLTPSDKKSFAYPTMKDRVPVIICKIIDLLYRDRANLKVSPDQIKAVIEKMSKLRYEMQTNKPLLYIEDEGSDTCVWNEFLVMLKVENNNTDPTWFSSRWLSVECFVYRRLLEAFRMSPDLATYDFFAKQKQEAFYHSLEAITNLLIVRDTWDDNDVSKLAELLKLSLWGNKCDLSISAGTSTSFDRNPLAQIVNFQSRLLVDDSQKVVQHCSSHKDAIIDIVMDNAGFELVSDLCLADYLISSGMAKKVRFRVKNQPWFVSDTMPSDIDWVLNEMSQGGINSLQDSTQRPILIKYYEKWNAFFNSGIWSVNPDPFWTYPHDFSMMRSFDKDLYSTLSQATCVIFKGDLNYRKLVGDLKWKPTDTFQEALQGFHPAPIIALRTLKADVITGLAEGQADSAAAIDEKWLVDGEWGVIQYCPRIQKD